MYTASEKGHVDVARVLLDRGADINQVTNDVCTPLMVAKHFKHTEIIRLLERARAQQSSCLLLLHLIKLLFSLILEYLLSFLHALERFRRPRAGADLALS